MPHSYSALGLFIGDPVRAKIAKEASTILKGVTEDSSRPPGYGRAARRQAPHPSRPRGPQCFRCFEWGHVACTCEQFQNFISDTIVDGVSAGVLVVWGTVGEVSSPHLVLPLTVEPSKPRPCHDERFLNLWIRDLPFKLDNLPDLPRYVLPVHFQTSFDDKSGYQHVLFTPPRVPTLAFNGMMYIFRVLHSSFRMEEQRLHLSQLGLAVKSAAGSHGFLWPKI